MKNSILWFAKLLIMNANPLLQSKNQYQLYFCKLINMNSKTFEIKLKYNYNFNYKTDYYLSHLIDLKFILMDC